MDRFPVSLRVFKQFITQLSFCDNAITVKNCESQKTLNLNGHRSFVYRWRGTEAERGKHYSPFSSGHLTARAAAETVAVALETQLRRAEKSWRIFSRPENFSYEGFFRGCSDHRDQLIGLSLG